MDADPTREVGGLDAASLDPLIEAVGVLGEGFADLPPVPTTDDPRLAAVLRETAERLHDNFPYHHPLYAGQMLKPPHPVARLAYGLAQYLNPNNHALDGGRASSAMEVEAVAQLARMAGWDTHLGHLTGGGTMANLEALWAASRTSPGTVLASEQAHYTHGRISAVLGLEFEAVAVDGRGRMDGDALRSRLAQGGVGTVVATLGTTGLGAVDPLAAILNAARDHRARVHVDAAYGGYFTLCAGLDDDVRAAYDALGGADSLVIDPHKHGLQPYGCGCVLFRDPAVGALYKHDSAYTYFTSADLHLGEISLECSRPGAAAVALWATHRLLPPEPGGEFARGLEAGLRAARDLYRRLQDDPRFLCGPGPELDIVVYAPRAPTASAVSRRTREVFAAAAARDLHLAVASFPREILEPLWPGVEFDEDTVACLRSVLMKPDHESWMDRIWDRLTAATDDEETCP